MREKQIRITQTELNELVEKEFQKKRRILFDLCAEAIAWILIIRKKTSSGKDSLYLMGKAGIDYGNALQRFLRI